MRSPRSSNTIDPESSADTATENSQAKVHILQMPRKNH